jgi:YidC/Oxa1 family membrane protein insertase
VSDIWYYGDGQTTVGPLSLAGLAKILSRAPNARDVLVWRDGFEGWQKASAVPELVSLVFKPRQPPPLPPPPSLPPSPSNLPSEAPLASNAAKTSDDRLRYREPQIAASSRRRNIVVAISLCAIVLLGWQFFYNVPQMERQRAAQQSQTAKDLNEQSKPSQALPSRTGPSVLDRDIALASAPRVKIDTPSINGSISLKGARIDDVTLVKYRETADPSSPAIALLSPSATDHPFYAEFGWIAASGSALKTPDQNTVWLQEGTGSLSPDSPVTVKYDNGEGLTFRRTISIDDRYLFSIKDEVANTSSAPVTLYPFALVSRHRAPNILSRYIMFEGLIGYLGNDGLQEYGYKKIDDQRAITFNTADGWLGITEKYWAAVLLPDKSARLQARFSSNLVGTTRLYQVDYLQAPQTIAVGGTVTSNTRLFAGAKEASIVGINFPFGPGGYNKQLGLNHFDLLIDWGWFWFATKPIFLTLAFFSHLFGNFGVAILIFAAIVKVIFVPFANNSYRSMIMMERLQPQIAAIRERTDDQVTADRQILELYKRENVTSPSGCLPILAQVLIFFWLYKIFYVIIEAHSPFFGWISDPAAPDPSNLFNLFGVLSFDPTTLPVFGPYLHVGAWPLILGLTVWYLRLRIRPIKLGSFQRIVYVNLDILVVLFASSMAVGLVICFAFYNVLSAFHQSLLMKKAPGTTGSIGEHSAALLPYGKSQPIIFLMMLAPVLQNIFMFLVFWRRSKIPKIKIAATST